MQDGGGRALHFDVAWCSSVCCHAKDTQAVADGSLQKKTGGGGRAWHQTRSGEYLNLCRIFECLVYNEEVLPQKNPRQWFGI